MIANSSATLLQEFTRHKLDAALETLEIVASKSHPFPEGLVALAGIRQHLIEIKQRVIRHNQSDIISKNYCRVAIEQLAETIPLIGFVDRSTETSGPVEFHDPFSRIVRKLLGENAKLILSSTWNFSPYTITYPDDVPRHVEDFVYVSFCVSESDNSILTPLAAHELGHNIWKKEGLLLRLKPIVGAEIVKLIQTEFSKKWPSSTGPVASAGDLVGQVAWQPAHFWAMKQLEESFCDFIGLYLFGPSYIYAFAHFISPGVNAGEPKYPQAHERFSGLLTKSKKEDWAIDSAFISQLFDVAVRPGEFDSSYTRELLLQIADRTRENLVDKVASIAHQIISDANLFYDSGQTEILSSQLDQGIPCSNSKSVMAIVNAGWDIFIRRFYRATTLNNWGFSISDTPRVINELILKSFEIYEIETRISEGEECLTQQKLVN